MKKFAAILMALVLALSVSVTSFAADTQSGEVSGAFADFDPFTADVFAGMDMSAITNLLGGADLSMITGLFEGLDVGMITDILGGLDLGGLLGGGSNEDEAPEEEPTEAPEGDGDNNNGDEDPEGDGEDNNGDEDPTEAPTEDNKDDEKPTEAPDNNDGDIPQTGDNGIVAAFAVCAVAAGAFIVLSKKKED